MRVSVVIAAGGLGKRFTSELPKQFFELKGIPILARTIGIFERIDAISDIVLTVPPAYISYTNEKIIDKYNFNKVKKIIEGGLERAASVYNALKALDPDTKIVLVHDGVRPFATEILIQNIILSAYKNSAAIPGLRFTDTVKQTDSQGRVVHTPDRNTFWHIQTPQGFSFPLLMKAYKQAKEEGFLYEVTDDSSLIERLGLAAVYMVEGEKNNIKITTKEDLLYGEIIAREEKNDCNQKPFRQWSGFEMQPFI